MEAATSATVTAGVFTLGAIGKRDLDHVQKDSEEKKSAVECRALI
jgi:hypothetical protein